MKKLSALTISLLFLTACSGTTASEKPTVTMSNDDSVTSFKMFLITPEKASRNGEIIGCGDGMISTDVFSEEKPTTVTDKLTAAYNQLLNFKTTPTPDPEMLNALANSNLKLDSVTIKDTTATIKISGELSLGGECDNPRVEAQLYTTGLQFHEISDLEIFINDKPLKDVLSLK
ncbi:GerMN domain-containing protein [Candidatus Peregrinibacteria bacterium]|nr:GerMN domain-containing protein [Candidatus Peregrinibacteria bacterium]